MKSKHPLIITCLALAISGSANAATLLLSDDFNDNPNGDGSTFNNNLSSTQSGTLVGTTYTVVGGSYLTQHSNGSRLLVATDSWGNGSVSLNNNFAIQANAADQALRISFNIKSVESYADTTRWVQFNVGASQNLAVGDSGVSAGILFRVNGATELHGSGGDVNGDGTWAADNLVTITLSGPGGVGSAFDGTGSEASISVGSTNYGPFTLEPQPANAYLTFSAFNYGLDQFGLGTFDNLSVSLIPEPSSALLGGLGLLALLRRRR
ncbi:MAG: hypothetical protein RLZZ505_2581 [Verrucomicrobiota bacterium]|jgi:hypothetical protein